MTREELLSAFERHPILAGWFAKNPTATYGLVEDVLAREAAGPPTPPLLPADAPEWERAYWERRAEKAEAEEQELVDAAWVSACVVCDTPYNHGEPVTCDAEGS